MTISRIFPLLLFLSQSQPLLSQDDVDENEPVDSGSFENEMQSDPLKSESFESESEHIPLDSSDCNEITGCTEPIESDDIDDINEEIAVTDTPDTISLDDLGVDIPIEIYPETEGEEEKEEMVVDLEGMEEEQVTVSWITYYMSIINLSVLVVAFAAAAICVMLIAYTLHKRRSADKPIDIENGHYERYDAEYSPSEYSPLNVVVI